MKTGFTKKKIREVSKVYSGATPKTEIPAYWDGDLLWITPNDLSKLDGIYFYDTERKITNDGLKSCSAHLLPKGTIVMSSRAPIGYLAIGAEEFCTNQGCKSLLFDDRFDSLFFYYNLQRYVSKLKQLGEGTTFAEISKSYLEEFEMEYPVAKSEQTRIAQILSKADQAIEQTEKLIAKYQRIKTGLMQDLLTKGIDEHGNIRSEITHRFKTVNGLRVPEEWEVKELRNYTTYISYGFTNPMPEAPEGPYLITAANVNEGRILYESCRRTTEKAFKELLTNKSRPKLNDILITKDGSLGRLAIVDRENLCINQSVAVIRSKDDKILNPFFKMLLESPLYQAIIIAEAGGSTIKHIYITKIDKMPLAVPQTLDEQERIFQIIEGQNKLILESEKQLHKLQSLKTGLMQDLLSGKVRVIMNHQTEKA